jgi:hypothetical protein
MHLLGLQPLKPITLEEIMRQFNDTKNKSWNIVININMVKLIRDVNKVDILKLLSDPETSEKVLGDIVCFSEILHTCVGTTESISEFSERFDGETLELAMKIFLEELIDFFPPKKRQILRSVLQKITESENTRLTEATTMVENMTIPSSNS